ncbi:MAG: phosphatase PAP2 family protein [Bacteroidales bacterium]|nr:phosphatase PAP2 family protein [Bacteroidales bacterium]
MIDTLDAYDKEIMLFLNFDGGAWLDNFWYLYSGKFSWMAAYVVILAVLFVKCKPCKSQWIALFLHVVCIALVITLADQISSGLIKNLVERPRPSHSEIEGMLHYVNGYKGGQFGFVSSHAANTIGLALWLCLLFRAPIFRVTMMLWALLTCYSRIYLGVHYLGDILGGICVGIFSTFMIHWVYKKYINDDYHIVDDGKEPWAITASIFLTIVVIAVKSLGF